MTIARQKCNGYKKRWIADAQGKFAARLVSLCLIMQPALVPSGLFTVVYQSSFTASTASLPAAARPLLQPARFLSARITPQPRHAPGCKSRDRRKRQSRDFNRRDHTHHIHQCPRRHAREGRDHLRGYGTVSY